MDRIERESRRDAFLAEVEDYAAARPGYPAELLRAATKAGGVEPGARVLDVGCGTGQATEWFLDQGHRVLAIDRSAEMLRLAEHRLGGRERLELREADFEGDAGLQDFDAIVFATSYHWLDPETRAARCARALRPGGALILLWHVHPVPYTGYFADAQPIYRRHVPGWAPPPSPGAREADLLRIVSEIEDLGDFDRVERRSVVWSRTYDRDLYVRLLNTYSDHKLLDPDVRARLTEELCELIDRAYDGKVERPYRSEAIVGVRGG